MADTVPASGTIDIPLSSSNVDMHSHLHHPPLPQHTTYNSDDNNPDDKKVISASLSELSAVAAINSNNNYQQHSCSPTNLSTTCNLFRCERCDNFETNSRATLLLHVVQCLSSPAKLKSEELDPENLSLSGTGAIHRIDQTKQTTSVLGGSVNNNNNHSNNSNSSKESLSNSNVAGSGNNANNSTRKVFECDVCNMKFSNGANMRRHKMRHTGVKPYECRVCQKRFFRKDHLAEHFTTHTKTLPYHCPICNRGFQRQIAMRAHFQNEHVGQHDLVKTCPLCSYRAGSMKSLRIHFHNRHGIDLDNPGSGGSSSLLLALESQASQAAAAVAAAANFMPNINTTSTIGATSSLSANNACNSNTTNNNNNQSDSGESLRSTDNPTPPMHFLTPHVEISMTENNGDLFNGNHSTRTTTPTPTTTPTTSAAASTAAVAASVINGDSLESRISQGSIIPSSSTTTHLTNICASSSPRIVAQDDAMDCNVKLCSSTISTLRMTSSSPKSNQYDNQILPSISLIPIKQEPSIDDSMEQIKNGHSSEESCGKLRMDNENIYNSSECSRLSSLIKVSPLKSLLREDLKRRICAKANNRVNRNNGNAMEHCNSTVIQNNQIRSSTISCNSTAICNGTITSSGQETDSSMASRKQILTCLFCGIEFPDETLYFLHKGCHCDSNPWKCNICGEQCNNVYEFNSHLLSKSHQ